MRNSLIYLSQAFGAAMRMAEMVSLRQPEAKIQTKRNQTTTWKPDEIKVESELRMKSIQQLKDTN
jgi:hypothetical protein